MHIDAAARPVADPRAGVVAVGVGVALGAVKGGAVKADTAHDIVQGGAPAGCGLQLCGAL